MIDRPPPCQSITEQARPWEDGNGCEWRGEGGSASVDCRRVSRDRRTRKSVTLTQVHAVRRRVHRIDLPSSDLCPLSTAEGPARVVNRSRGPTWTHSSDGGVDGATSWLTDISLGCVALSFPATLSYPCKIRR